MDVKGIIAASSKRLRWQIDAVGELPYHVAYLRRFVNSDGWAFRETLDTAAQSDYPTIRPHPILELRYANTADRHHQSEQAARVRRDLRGPADRAALAARRRH